MIKKHKEKHGHTGDSGKIMSPTYRTWVAMKQRCLNPMHSAYYKYGGRGIWISKRWRKSFIHFLEDMGERPQGMSLDRIDNNSGYCKKNCRWATPKEQMNNTRINLKFRKIVYQGKEYNMIDKLVELSKESGVKVSVIKNRMARGLTLEQAVSIKGTADLNIVFRMRDYTDEMINSISDRREKLILRLRQEGKTLEAIADMIGITRERVRQIQKKATEALDKEYWQI